MSGVIRAAKRLAAKRAANALIPDCPVYTRQQRRAKERAAAKLTRVSPAEAGRRVMKAKRAPTPTERHKARAEWAVAQADALIAALGES